MKTVYDFFSNLHFRTKRRKFAFATIFSLALVAAWQIQINQDESIIIPERIYHVPEVRGQNIETDSGFIYHPGPISMDKMKRQGCVADGLLSGYGSDIRESVTMVNRSNCVYLHRALETWGEPPNFEKSNQIMQRINKPGVIYGMFIAENIKKNAEYLYIDENRKFDFRDMCAPGTDNRWGEHTCIPTFKRKEYRRYVKYITHQAMDHGIQSFLFGQVYYQDNPKNNDIGEVLDDMRAYAKEKGIEIAIGAQTGNITDEKYLRSFDYIEGGVGIGDDGMIESGPCWSHLQSCWALLWHDNYSKKANNVLLHLDWSGLDFDDMSVFARMEQNRRKEVLNNLYTYFTSRDMGFLMPMMATINKENGGCYGPKKKFYSAYNGYSCKDEDIINTIIK